MNIYVGNLSVTMTEARLKALFEAFGEIETVKVIKDKFSGKAKGYGFVEMPSNSDADKAIKSLNGNHLDGNYISVKPADPGGKRKNKRSLRKKRF